MPDRERNIKEQPARGQPSLSRPQHRTPLQICLRVQDSLADSLLRPTFAHRRTHKHVRPDPKLRYRKMPLRPYLLNPKHDIVNGEQLRSLANVILHPNPIPRPIHSLPLLLLLHAREATPKLEHPNLHQHRNKRNKLTAADGLAQ